MSKWIRPSAVKFPRVWKSFNGKTDSFGNHKKYWIQDVTDEYQNKVIEFTLRTFLKEEPLFKFSGIPHNIASREFTKIWQLAFNQKTSIMCLTDSCGPNPIITGVNFTMVVSKEDNSYRSENENVNKILETIEFMNRKGKTFERFGVNEYLTAMGLYVHPEHRGNGIGYNLLKARDSLCKTFGLKLTTSMFTSKYSQKSAEKAGFQNLFTISYTEMANEMPSLEYPGIEHHTPVVKLMYKLYN